MEKVDNDYNLEKFDDGLFITNDDEIIAKQYRQYKVIAVVSKKELLDAIEKIWENRWWIEEYDVIKLTAFKDKINVSSFNRRNKLSYKTTTINLAFVSNPSGKNITFFVKTDILKKALSLIADDKIIIRAGSNYRGSDYIIIKSHNIHEKTIIIIN